MRGDFRKNPEGPYDRQAGPHTQAIAGEDFSYFVDFVESFSNEAARSLSIRRGFDEMPIIIALLRNHLAGKLTTTSFLVASSGLGYGTAIRSIKMLEEKGLLIKRPRTRTGKSFSLHPSEKLIAEWQEFSRRIRGSVGGILGSHAGGDGGYFYGSSYNDSSIIPPPASIRFQTGFLNKMSILGHADPTFMAMNVLKRQFEGLLGVHINLRALSIDRLRQEIINNAGRKVSEYDIVACDLPWFGEMAAEGILMPIDAMIAESGLDLSDFHQSVLASTRYRGQHYALPVQATPELLVARRDLFEDAGLTLPVTIGDTLAAARRLHGQKQSGIAWNAGRGTPLGHSFMFVMGAMGQPCLDLKRERDGFDGEWVDGENNRPMLMSDAAVDTADYFMELLNYSPSTILSMSWYERAHAYAEGRVAMAYCATLLAPLFESNPESAAHGVTEYLPHPHGPRGKPIAPVGGYALAIPANIKPEKIYPIWTSLQFFTSPEAIKLYIKNGSLVNARHSVSEDPEVSRISPIISAVDNMARNGILQYWPRPPVPEFTELITIIGEEMHDMLQGSLTIKQALANAQNRADALMRQRGHY